MILQRECAIPRRAIHLRGLTIFRGCVALATMVMALSAKMPTALVSSNLQNEATALANQIASHAAAIHQLSLQEVSTQQRYQQLTTALAKSSAQLKGDLFQMASNRSRLGAAAIAEYINGAGVSTIGSIVTSSLQQYLLRSDYQGVAASSVADLIIAYNDSVVTVAQRRKFIDWQRKAVLANLRSLHRLDAALSSEVSSEQSALRSVNGQIQVLVQAAIARRYRKATVQGLPSPSGLGGSAAQPTANLPTGVIADLSGIRRCESGGNYSDNTGNGYYGAYQFSEGTWLSLGFTGYPNTASPSTQDLAAADLARRSGWGQWPACALVLGLI